jgi:hypothetical protein
VWRRRRRRIPISRRRCRCRGGTENAHKSGMNLQKIRLVLFQSRSAQTNVQYVRRWQLHGGTKVCNFWISAGFQTKRYLLPIESTMCATKGVIALQAMYTWSRQLYLFYYYVFASFLVLRATIPCVSNVTMSSCHVLSSHWAVLAGLPSPRMPRTLPTMPCTSPRGWQLHQDQGLEPFAPGSSARGQ